MRILITGGAGFLGSHLCDRLISEGNKVVCVDNLVTGDISNIEHLQGNASFEFMKCDVTRQIRIDGAIDYVLHFASPASPADFKRLSLQILRVGSVGTINMLELAFQKKAKFIFASSSEVYGNALVNPQKEDYWGNVNPIGIRAVYDEGKRFSETATMSWRRKHGLDTRIARIFNTYGPRMRKDDGRVISTFIVQALSNQPITVFGDGSQTRSFCYVSDLVEGIYKLMLSDIHQPVNLGNPEELTICEVAGRILKITDSRSQICYRPLPQDDPKLRKPDIARAEQSLQWSPKTTLDVGLRHTIDWFKKLGR